MLSVQLVTAEANVLVVEATALLGNIFRNLDAYNALLDTSVWEMQLHPIRVLQAQKIPTQVQLTLLPVWPVHLALTALQGPRHVLQVVLLVMTVSHLQAMLHYVLLEIIQIMVKEFVDHAPVAKCARTPHSSLSIVQEATNQILHKQNVSHVKQGNSHIMEHHVKHVLWGATVLKEMKNALSALLVISAPTKL